MKKTKVYPSCPLPEWSEGEAEGLEGRGQGTGVVMGGSARGWLPDVAAVLWRRMLAALGDPNQLKDPNTHHKLYNYLIHLNSTLIKVSWCFSFIRSFLCLYRLIRKKVKINYILGIKLFRMIPLLIPFLLTMNTLFETFCIS